VEADLRLLVLLLLLVGGARHWSPSVVGIGLLIL
jgi:hypothetical protein